MACVSRAAIIGGGVAGLAAGIALRKAGVECDLVELVGGAEGASLGLSGRAAEALADLDIYDECYANGTPWEADTRAASQSDAAGNMISPGPARPNWPGARTPVGIYRPKLAEILENKARSLGVNIRIGVSAESITETDAGAVVKFSDGVEGTYDLVIGADGIKSRTREMIFPDAPSPRYSGQVSIRWMAPGPKIVEEGWYNGPLGRVGFYYLPQGMIYVPAVVDMPELRRMTPEEEYAYYVRLLESYTAPAIVELRRRLTPDAKLIFRPFNWILVPDIWHKGRTLLIGDAAHATTAHMGMGAGMALEDAVVLGQCIAQAETLEQAFERFMARRYERVKTVVETSVAASQLELRNAPTAEKMALLATGLKAIAQPY
ncbi:hypothetical protein GCM10007897_02930 [Sphingobium jiangsuense]|uniref:2-polyprenyl-6-methoxyphenol hydroxylase-like FAD-dependent oxidoreductase n=1 Tax=Sphingobium jiangsuense TaxID=870476 RepID=A0A7W6BJ85_9SPHN|nr:FAD-dependent monooxygenase [Sphingobium jiangsuense]MBB3925982.1 2-polyprenyl-6-methoxyphenol hydroxylase-like FAD-dependent oxidoreductase [Sphingobium jiangsuense]GLS98915.1 hypothetical protein GCM10007897_02930 [Sphingobium jiangsuense]